MNKKWINRQKDRQTQKETLLAHLKNPTLWVSNASPPGSVFLYSPHMEGVTLKGSLWPA